MSLKLDETPNNTGVLTKKTNIMKTDEYKPSKRKYTDVETGEEFVLYVGETTHGFKLISHGSKRYAPGTEINGFYLCAFTGCVIKLNTGKQVKLNTGQFYNLKETDNGVIEQVISRKFDGFNKFVKV
jgi:hypothetical protein